jgi:tryptophan-rich sensory protein
MSFFYSTDDDEDPKQAARRPMLAFVLLTLAVGAAASAFSEPALRDWYITLAHPAFSPPNWMFAWVWTALYILTALAAWRVWRITGMRSLEIASYAIQLGLNFAWSWLFFGLHRIGAAFAEILVLDVAVLLTTALFFRRDRLAGLLFLPYLGWSIFASFLTHAIWSLNA